MKFSIKQNSTLPELVFPLKNSLLEKYDITEEMLKNVVVTFSMVWEDKNVYKTANKTAKLVINNGDHEFIDDEKYGLSYKFSLKDTSKQGKFNGEFKIDFLGTANCGKLTLPVGGEKIEINIIKSITRTQTTNELGDNIPSAVNAKPIQIYQSSELYEQITEAQKNYIQEQLIIEGVVIDANPE